MNSIFQVIFIISSCGALTNSTEEIVYEDKIVKFDPKKTHLKPEREVEEPVTNPVYFYGMAILLSIITLFLLYKILTYIFSNNDNE